MASTSESATEARCSGCGATRPLPSPLPEGDGPAARYALALAKIMLCDECAEREEEVARKAAARAEVAASERRLERSGLPQPLRGLRFDAMERSGERAAAIDAAREWATGAIHGLFLAGPVGTGKTRLAATAAMSMLTRRSLRWVSVPALFASMGAAYTDEARARAIADLTGTQALVLDDIDKARPSAWGREQLYTAIDSRYTAGAPLLVTANAALDVIGQTYGDAIMSRLAGYCKQYELRGSDRRLG